MERYPFAQPPLGTLCLRAPQAPRPWSGVRDATAFGLVAPHSDPMQQFFSASGRRLAFSPMVDGVVLPQQPMQAIAQGSADGISLLIGTNEELMPSAVS